jgi:hypothetical protein
VDVIRLAITVDPQGATPRELRARFVHALRAAVFLAALAGHVDIAFAEELWRAIPDPERA